MVIRHFSTWFFFVLVSIRGFSPQCLSSVILSFSTAKLRQTRTSRRLLLSASHQNVNLKER